MTPGSPRAEGPGRGYRVPQPPAGGGPKPSGATAGGEGGGGSGAVMRTRPLLAGLHVTPSGLGHTGYCKDPPPPRRGRLPPPQVCAAGSPFLRPASSPLFRPCRGCKGCRGCRSPRLGARQQGCRGCLGCTTDSLVPPLSRTSLPHKLLPSGGTVHCPVRSKLS